jgi:hypothetical protein
MQIEVPIFSYSSVVNRYWKGDVKIITVKVITSETIRGQIIRKVLRPTRYLITYNIYPTEPLIMVTVQLDQLQNWRN